MTPHKYLLIAGLLLLLAAACSESLPPAAIASPTPLITATAIPLPIPVAGNTVQQLVTPSEPSTIVSLDGDVTISMNRGAVEDPTVLVYASLSPSELPPLPEGFVPGGIRFDLSHYDPDGTQLPRLSLPGVIEVMVALTVEDLRLAEGDTSRITLQHYSDGRWASLPATVNLKEMTLTARVDSLSVFAVLIESESADTVPAERVAALRASPTPAPTSTPTPVPTPAPKKQAKPIRADPTPAPLTVGDGNGNDVVFVAAPERIVAYDASAVETLFAIGEGDRVAGTHSFVFYPPEVADIPKLGGAFSIDVEATVVLNPDLVYIFFPTFNDQLESAGLKVLYVKTLNDDFRLMTDRFRTWGSIVNAEVEAEALADDFDTRVEDIEDIMAAQPDGPSVFWDTFQLFTPGPDTLIGEVLDLLKLQNIASDVSGFEQISPELLVARDPEIIFTFDASFFTDNPAYSEVSAVKNGRFLPTEDLLSIDGPRFIDGIEQLAAAAYPELFP